MRDFLPTFERFGKNVFWSIKNSCAVIIKLKSRGLRASSLSTYVFFYIIYYLIKYSVNSLKSQLNRCASVVPKYYYSGNRKLQILHTRLRTNCSSLSNDLFLKNISESPLCLCGIVANTEHYFMHCRIYEAQRAELSQTVSQYSPFTLETLLFGNNTPPLNINTLIVDAVKKYIKDTKRSNLWEYRSPIIQSGTLAEYYLDSFPPSAHS